MKVAIEIGVLNESNHRGSWGGRAERLGLARYHTKEKLKAALGRKPLRPVLTVTLTRVAPGNQLLDNDGLVTSLKGARDGVADALHVDDKTKLIRWAYSQRKGDWGIEVEVRPSTEAEAHLPRLVVLE